MMSHQYKIWLGVFLLNCVFIASANAYVVGQNLIIENNTRIPMVIKIERPNNQGPIVKQVPALRTIDLYFENGDSSGWLYQLSYAPFSISGEANQTEYVNGNVVFYVGSSYSRKYSFLNEVKAGQGISLDTVYTCDSGSGVAFQNKIIIDGTPSAKVARLTKTRICQGLLSSSLDVSSTVYRATCHDHQSATFIKTPSRGGACHWGSYYFYDCTRATKGVLDGYVGGSYCKTAAF